MSEIQDFEPLWGVWKAESRLGEGSFGSVWKVKRDGIGGEAFYAAVKHISIPKDSSEIAGLIRAGVIADEASAAQYYDSLLQSLSGEIRAMHQLQGYTNIVSYEDHMIIPKHNGVGYDLFLRMELLTPLRDRIRRGMTLEDVLRLGIDIAGAIGVLNRFGMVHGDIKPQNIFVNELGNYKLGDYGIGRILNGGRASQGARSYMAPEVYHGQRPDGTADLYSLGLVLYRMLNGNRPPFLPAKGEITGSMREEAVARRLRGEPLPGPEYADEELSRILLKACAYQAGDRYRNTSEFKQALENYLTAEDAAAEDPGKPGNPEPQEDPFTRLIRGQAKQRDAGQGIREEAVPAKLPEPAPKKSRPAAPSRKKRKKKKARRRRAVILTALVLLLLIGAGFLACGLMRAPSAAGEGSGTVWRLFPALQSQPDDSLIWRMLPFLRPAPESSETGTGQQDASGQDTGDTDPVPDQGGKTEKKSRGFKEILYTILPFLDPEKGESGQQDSGVTPPGSGNGQEPGQEQLPEWMEALQPGSPVRFGAYEQDNDLSNGKEPIEWTVLERDGNRVLLVSRYGLDCRPYHEVSGDITWEHCSLRKWLNETFYPEAFSEQEQAAVQEVSVENRDATYGIWDGLIVWNMDDPPPAGYVLASGGRNTNDRVFLLSAEDDWRYLPACELTAYAREQGRDTLPHDEGITSLGWWLRSPGASQNTAAVIELIYGPGYDFGSYYGLAQYSTDYAGTAVRPAVWAELKPDLFQPVSGQERPGVGDTVLLGRYEQDRNPFNGTEEVEWTVLDVDGDRAFLISRYVLDSQPYHRTLQNVTWEECSLREWLNHGFLQRAFSTAEKAVILPTTVSNASRKFYEKNYGGNDTEDRVFLLSYEEASYYYRTASARACTETFYAFMQPDESYGVFPYEGDYSPSSYCRWWLRSPQDTMHYSEAGSVDYCTAEFVAYDQEEPGSDYIDLCLGIRPVLWISRDSGLIETGPVGNEFGTGSGKTFRVQQDAPSLEKENREKAAYGQLYADFLAGKAGMQTNPRSEFLFSTSSGQNSLGEGTLTLPEYRAKIEQRIRDEWQFGERIRTETEYAWLDCGNDGNKELAVRMRFPTPIENWEVYLILKEEGDTLKECLAVDAYARKRVTLNSCGYLDSDGSNGASSHIEERFQVDAEGNGHFLVGINTDSNPTYVFLNGVYTELPEGLYRNRDADLLEYYFDPYPSSGSRSYFVLRTSGGNGPETEIPNHPLRSELEKAGVRLTPYADVQALVREREAAAGYDEQIMASAAEPVWLPLD